MNRIKQVTTRLSSPIRRNIMRSLATTTEDYQQRDLNHLLQRNRIWAQQKRTNSPALFPSLATTQSPKILWIGCSDSRVPETEIFGAEPGEFFVHRNIANLIRHDDINLEAALQFAVEGLKVNHIIVCGHYNCGGVKAALDGCPFHSVNNWVKPLTTSIKDSHIDISDMSESQAWRHAVHSNILRSTQLLRTHPILQRHLPSLTIHPWLYDPGTGLITPLSDPSLNNASTVEFHQPSITFSQS